MPKAIQRTPQSRVFTIENQAGPANVPRFQGFARAGGVSWPQGDVKPVRVPSASSYDQFEIVDEILGEQGLPTMSVMFRKSRDLSDVLKLATGRCPFDAQVHFGTCGDPSDFDGGWELIAVLERARATAYSTDDLGALDSDQNATITETLPMTARQYYEITRVNGALIGQSQITDEVIDVLIADARSCGECGLPSDGAQRVFALVRDNSGSPGLPAELEYSQDGGATISSAAITTLALASTVTSMFAMGPFLVVISNGENAIHYAELADIVAGTASWTKVTTGWAGGGAIVDAYVYDSSHAWVIGLGGYIYSMSNPASGGSAQTSGDVTTQNLTAIHGIDDTNIIAVGASNAVLVTRNGGKNWASVTGPVAGVTLNACWMRSANEWFVGSAAGKLYYTRDGGTTWHEKTFPGSGAGRVRDIKFSTPTVGWMAHEPAIGGGSARVLRTVDGGYSWYVLPEASGQTMPSSSYINNLAVTDEDPNLCYAGGLATDNNDGVWIKIA